MIRKDAALAGREDVAMIATSRDKGRQDGHSAGLAAAPSNDSPELLSRLQRLAGAPSKAFKDNALLVEWLLAEDGEE